MPVILAAIFWDCEWWLHLENARANITFTIKRYKLCLKLLIEGMQLLVALDNIIQCHFLLLPSCTGFWVPFSKVTHSQSKTCASSWLWEILYVCTQNVSWRLNWSLVEWYEAGGPLRTLHWMHLPKPVRWCLPLKNWWSIFLPLLQFKAPFGTN